MVLKIEVNLKNYYLGKKGGKKRRKEGGEGRKKKQGNKRRSGFIYPDATEGTWEGNRLTVSYNGLFKDYLLLRY